MKAQVLATLTSLVVVSQAACPNQGYLETIDLHKFMGTWYQYSSFGTLFMQGINRCVMSNYELGEDGKTIKMVNNFILKGLKNGVRSFWTATASDASKPTGKLDLEVKLPGSYGNIPMVGKMTLPLMVLDTDYENYAVLYACKKILVNQFDYGFVFTRKRSLEESELEEILPKVDAALAKVGVKRSKFAVTNQENCDDASFTVDLASVAKTVETMTKTAATVSKFAPLLALFG